MERIKGAALLGIGTTIVNHEGFWLRPKSQFQSWFQHQEVLPALTWLKTFEKARVELEWWRELRKVTRTIFHLSVAYSRSELLEAFQMDIDNIATFGNTQSNPC